MGGFLDTVLRRDRLVVASALVAMTVVAWGYLLTTSDGWIGDGVQLWGRMADTDMSRMDMPDMDMPATGDGPSATRLFAFAAPMWLIMMIGMMIPSASPMVLIYAGVARRAVASKQSFASTGWFVGGYLLVWCGFALLAAAAQVALGSRGLLGPEMSLASRHAGGVLLILAGLYQVTPLKQACLRACQGPLAFIARQGGFPQTRSGALVLGLRHGLYCLGCCWALMLLLFALGIMNLLLIAALSIFVLLEKVVPWRPLPVVAAAVLVAGGLLLLLI